MERAVRSATAAEVMNGWSMSRSSRIAAVALTLALVGTSGVVATAASAASVPARPSTAPASGNGWVAIKWSASAGNGKPVLGYQVATRRYVASTGTWTRYSYVRVSASARSRTLVASNGSKVQLLVRARNAVGYGAWGRVATVAGLPAPVPGTRVAAGDRKATVTWSAASSNGSAITSYRVYVRTYSSGTWSAWSYRTSTPSSRSARFTGLTNNRAYQFHVRAVNARGVGARGAAITVRPSVPGASTTTASVPAEVARILADTNAFRAANGKPALKAMTALDSIAGEWAKKMHDQCIFEHRSSFSVYPSGWSRAGENIAAGYSYTSVVQGWIDSPGHRANMLGDYTHIGIGYYAGSNCYRTYFVQNFAKY
jgi:uncharacterized protein YkwD